ncbi:hypothetical protein WMF31_21755 [Sorangium sp. So ce1036]|uniref:antibiotic biosynthesis monooxygenase family protein n=1 Tax=Sorangium sp. So ce1036 TaxID=3133328 RepID=UPI003F02C780
MMNRASLQRFMAGLGIVAAMAGAGCADDGERSASGAAGGGAGGGGGAPQGSPFDGCSKGELEPDRQGDTILRGPGVDPETGALPPGNYLISTTYLALKPEMTQRAMELGGPIMQSLFTMKGLVGAATLQSTSCVSLRTLSVWESEEDMFAFVGSPAHANAMGHITSISRGSSNVISWEASEAQATWEEAARRLASEAGGDI